MRRTLGALLTAGLTATVVGSAAVPAAAEAPPPPPTAKVYSVSAVALPGAQDRALVAGTFSCTGKFSHLWVSSKQGPGDLKAEGSSQTARAWYQVTTDNTVPCDGRRHTRVFQLASTKGDLRAGGFAYVQFCLYTANSMADMQAGRVAFASDMRYRPVVRL